MLSGQLSVYFMNLAFRTHLQIKTLQGRSYSALHIGLCFPLLDKLIHTSTWISPDF